MLLRICVFVLALCAGVPSWVAAQQNAASPQSAEAAQLADGWSRLAKGDAVGAAQVASQALAKNPLSAAAATLAVDADLARGGTTAALNSYEKWLGARRLDDGYVLRRVARALLVDASAAKQPNVAARVAALGALAADGDTNAEATLQTAAVSGRFGETRALAETGNERAVKLLIAQLATAPLKTPIIDALAESGSKLAVPPLKALLSDPSDINRAAAADALGRLGATDTIPQLRAMLNDQVFIVKLKAAGALFRLNDSTGLPFLNEVAQSEHAAIRVAAARELASQPDTLWQNTVRGLLNDPDPVVRMEAARLIAPYDQAIAQRTLDQLMRDGNIAVRESASGILVDRVAGDFATLRGLLRSGDLIVQVKAADRILELTR